MINTSRQLVQSQTHILANSPLQNPVTTFNKFFPIQHLLLLLNFPPQLQQQFLRKYNSSFQPMIDTTILWQRYYDLKEHFDLFQCIFQLEKKRIILMFIFALLAGFTFLLGSYLVFQTVQAIIDSNRTNAWTYGGIMIGSYVLKLILFSYSQNMSNNIATNAKLYIQNAFLKSLLQGDPKANRQKLLRVFFYDIQGVRQLFLILPYMIVAVVTVIGPIVFIFVDVREYGLITLLFFILAIICIVFLYLRMHRIMKQSEAITDRRSNLSAQSFKNLRELSFCGLNKIFYNQISHLRQQQTQIYGKYSLTYFYIQFIADFFPIICIIIYFSIARNNPNFGYVLALKCLSRFGIIFTPIRTLLFCITFILTAIKSLNNISSCLSNKRIRYINQKYGSLIYGLTAQNLGDFASGGQQYHEQPEQILMVEKQSCGKIQVAFNEKLMNITVGKTTIIDGRIDCQPSVKEYIDIVLQQIYKKSTVACLERKKFIIEGSIRDNITLYDILDNQRYQLALKITQLDKIVDEMDSGDNTLVSENSIKKIPWLSTQIELARAVYHNVDYLVIKKGLAYGEQILVGEIFKYRKMKGLTNLMLYNYNGLIDQVDYFICINQNEIVRKSRKDYEKQIDKIPSTKQKISEISDHNLSEIFKVQKIQLNNPEVELRKPLMLFYQGNAIKSLLVLLSIFFTPLIRFYITDFVPRSKDSPNIYQRLIFSALLYLILVLIRGFVVTSFYTQGRHSIFMRLANKLYNIGLEKIQRLYNRRQTTNLQIYISTLMNQNLYRDCQIGYYLLMQFLVAVISSIGNEYRSMAIIIPVNMAIFIFFGWYLGALTQILLMKQSRMNTANLFTIDLISYAKGVIGYRKCQIFFKKFTDNNRRNIIYDLNEMWSLVGTRVLVETAIFFGFVIILLVFIESDFDKTKPQHIALFFVGVGGLNELSNIMRYIFKENRHFQFQLIGIAQIFRIIKNEPTEEVEVADPIQKANQKKVVNKFSKISYLDVSVKIFQLEICRRVSFQLNAGCRYAFVGDITYAKQCLLGVLHNNVLSRSNIVGQILIDSSSYQDCKLEGLNVIQSQAIFPKGLTVLQVMQVYRNTLTEKQLQRFLNRMWSITNLRQSFNCSTPINRLNDGERDLLCFIQRTMVRHCCLLVISGGLSHLDTVTMENMMNYLTKQNNIPVIVHLSNDPTILEYYQKRLMFSDKSVISLTKEQMKNFKRK